MQTLNIYLTISFERADKDTDLYLSLVYKPYFLKF